jgi:hypothetical protein
MNSHLVKESSGSLMDVRVLNNSMHHYRYWMFKTIMLKYENLWVRALLVHYHPEEKTSSFFSMSFWLETIKMI